MNRLVLNTALATSITRVFGFIRTSFISSFLGTSSLADSFFLAFKIPNMFRRILAEGAMQSGFIPIFSSFKETDSKNEKWIFFTSISIFSFVICIVVILLGIVFSKQLIKLFCIFSKTNTENIRQTTTMLQIMFPYLGFICMASILQSTLNSFGFFVIPALSPIFLSLSIIWGCYLGNSVSFSQINIAKLISYSVLIGGILQLFFLLAYFWYNGYLYKVWKKNILINLEYIRMFLHLLIPFVISNSTQHLGSLILDPVVLSLGAGSFAALQYSIRLQELPLGIITVSITTVYLPVLSKGFFFHEKKLGKNIEKIFLTSMLLIIPCITIALFFYKDIVSIVYQGGLFSQNSLTMTSECFFYHGIGILPISCNRIFVSIYQANKNTKTPAKLALIYLSVDIFLAFFICSLSPHPKSIAIAALISTILYSLLLMKDLPTKTLCTISGVNIFSKSLVIFFMSSCAILISKNFFNWSLDITQKNLFDYVGYFSSEKFFLLCRLFFSSTCVGFCILLTWFLFFKNQLSLDSEERDS